MLIALSLLVCIIGLLVYVLSANPKIMQLGLVAYGCGLLAFLICVCNSGASLGITAK